MELGNKRPPHSLRGTARKLRQALESADDSADPAWEAERAAV